MVNASSINDRVNMFRVIFHNDPETNSKIQKWVGIFTIIAFLGAGGTWLWNIVEPQIEKIATEEEVREIDTASMAKHKMENAQYDWADKSDVNHIANLLVDAQLQTIQDDIDWYVDEAKNRELTVKEAKILGRLEARKEQLNKSFIPEPGALHSHGGIE